MSIEATYTPEAKKLIADLHSVDSKLASWAWAEICEHNFTADQVRQKLREVVGMSDRK